MYVNYWHIDRNFRLADMPREETLPFGEPPIVLGRMVSIPEPVWTTIIATILTGDTEDFFSTWKWETPLPTTDASALVEIFDRSISNVVITGEITPAADLSPEDRTNADTLLPALRAVRDLLALAVARDSAVETWTE
ncbi:hypothetical protein AB0C38_30505 [Amycolatopsis sp. NPDC048633]|uniref:hypothetical protein n=1 Tax=Amycolatopsis sp. NPDC048633 TaxID=3157095 RepID=UPI0033CB4684